MLITTRVAAFILLFASCVARLGAADASESVATEFKQLLLADEDALDKIDRLVAENEAFAREGAGLPRELLSTKMHSIVDPVRERYEAFLKRHPEHVRAHLAYASFLGEFSEAPEVSQHLEKALALAPDDPVVLNNVAKLHGEQGRPTEAFRLLRRALELKPYEPTYLRNLASIMLVYQPEATVHFGLKHERQLFARVTDLYRRAVARQPDDFLLLTSLAQSLYRLDPFPQEEAAKTWERALQLAGTQTEKEGVMIHLARIHIRAKQYRQARHYLNNVTKEELQPEKKKLIAAIPKEMNTVEFKAATGTPSLFNLSTTPPPKPVIPQMTPKP